MLVSWLWPSRLNDEHTIWITRSIKPPWLTCTVSRAASTYVCNISSSPLVDPGGSAGALRRYWFYNSVPNSHKNLTQPFNPGFTPLECVIGAIAKIFEPQRYNNLKVTFTIFIIKYFISTVLTSKVVELVSEYFNLHTDGSGVRLGSCSPQFIRSTKSIEKKTTQKQRQHSRLQCFQKHVR